jgi:hypothetical protein
MTTYVLLRGTQTGVRVADEATGETVSIGGRLLDNMTSVAAEEARNALARLARAKDEHRAGEIRRNDLLAILDRRASTDA